MDSKVQSAFDIANYVATLSSQKQILFEEYTQNLIYYHNGGIFSASKELINFVKTLVDLEIKTTVLVDDNNLPIDVADTSKFFEDLLSKYQFAVNGYFTKYSSLKKSRSVESLTAL